MICNKYDDNEQYSDQYDTTLVTFKNISNTLT